MPDASTPHVLVSFIHSDRETVLFRSLVAAFDQTYPEFSVLLVDTSSSAKLESTLKSRFPKLIYHKSETSGIASARNFAMSLYLSRNDDFVLLLDDDIQMERDCLSTLVAAMNDSPSTGMTVPLILNEDGTVLSAGGIYYRRIGQPRLMRAIDASHPDLDFASGAIGLYRKEVIAMTGPFDTAFDPYGFEDIDYGLRINDKGYRVRLVDRAQCRHLSSYSFHKEQGFFLYHTTKHRLICACKHTGALSFLLASLPWYILRRIIVPAIKFALQGKTGLSFEVFRGFKDGLKEIVENSKKVSARQLSNPSPDDKGISVVYPTRDRPELLRRSILALLNNSDLPDEILVADQSRTDLTRRMLMSLDNPRIVHIASRETGLSRGRNCGIRASRFPVVGFLDDDCIPAKDWISSARKAMQEYPNSVVWIGEVYRNPNDDPEAIPATIPEDHLTLTKSNDPWLVGPTGGNSFFRKTVFDKVGLFDPLLGQGSDFPGAEDGDMTYRILKQNFSVTYTNTIRCIHVGWRDDEDNIQNGYNYGSGVGAMLAKFAARGDYYPLWNIFPRRFLSRFLSLPYNILLGRKKKFWTNLKWSQGIADGFIKWRRMNKSRTTGDRAE